MNILFVAEASAGKSYGFYFANTLLFETIKTAFDQFFDIVQTDEDFLICFQQCGCVMEHLCEKTVTKESSEKRLAARRKCIPDLAAKIKTERPRMLIVLVPVIVNEVHEAVQVAATGTVQMIRAVPYPSKSEKHRLDCIAAIVKALREAEKHGLLSDHS